MIELEPRKQNILSWEEYTLLAPRTLPDLDQKYRGEDVLSSERLFHSIEEGSKANLFNSLHTTVGMLTEVGELYDCWYPSKPLFVDKVNFGEECGDICWYLAIYTRLHSISIQTLSLQSGMIDLYTVEDLLYKLLSRTASLLDLDKRHFAYGKYDRKDRDQQVNMIHLTLRLLVKKLNLNFEEILYKNIKKLVIRYPEKFNEADATVRDLVKERKLLEE